MAGRGVSAWSGLRTACAFGHASQLLQVFTQALGVYVMRRQAVAREGGDALQLGAEVPGLQAQLLIAALRARTDHAVLAAPRRMRLRLAPAVEFWQGMLNSPDMTGPLAAWITDQMVAAADTALKKTQALIAGIAAQLDIARGLVGAPSSIPEVPQPEAVDTSNRDMLQKQLDATRDLTDAITKAFESAFSAAHKAHIDFVQGTISEGDYLSKYQAAQDAFNAKNANARQAEALEAQVKAAQAAIDAETAARQKAYDQAVKDRQAAVDAETAARKQAVKQLEQAQRDAQMQMTQAVIDESTQRISQYEKELKKASDPKERAELKAKIALEKERIDVANQLAGAITAANNATNDFDLSVANAQIEYFTAQLEALGQVDVGGL